MNNIEAFKDEPNEGSKIYLFNLPNIYYAELKKDELNSNIGCTVFFFKADIFVSILLNFLSIILHLLADYR